MTFFTVLKPCEILWFDNNNEKMIFVLISLDVKDSG
jgi:hypothetical protein